MYSLITTVKCIKALYSNAQPLSLNQYWIDVETSLPHGEKYLIPSLIWPPPPAPKFKFEWPKNESFMSPVYEVYS